ncbi:transcriptional regulator with GAF, ATPase, and Fis domain [Mycetocola sp. CAN_C7]|uniref:GAF domain-containing protein n=1 Tax=Mycetocola sp. CAN_C7 TaxID=2787724 RepID=UPI001A2F14D4
MSRYHLRQNPDSRASTNSLRPPSPTAASKRRSKNWSPTRERFLRVAELVARGATPDDVFAAVVEELGRVVHVQGAKLLQYDAADTATFASWGPLQAGISTGSRLSSKGTSVTAQIRKTGLPARVDDDAPVSGDIGASQRSAGTQSAVGAPFFVGGRLWGAVIVGSLALRPLPAGTEDRIGKFADLIAIAIYNLESRAPPKKLRLHRCFQLGRELFH